MAETSSTQLSVSRNRPIIYVQHYGGCRVVACTPPVPSNRSARLRPEQMKPVGHCHAHVGKVVVVTEASDFVVLLVQVETRVSIIAQRAKTSRGGQ